MSFSIGRGSYRGNMGDRGQPVTRGKSTLNGKTVAAAAEEAARVAAAEEAARVAAAEEAARVAAAEEAVRVAEEARYATFVPAQEFVPYEERKAKYFEDEKRKADHLEFLARLNSRNDEDEAALRYRNRNHDLELEDSLKNYNMDDFKGGARKKKKYTQTQTRQKKQHRRRRRRHSTRKHKK